MGFFKRRERAPSLDDVQFDWRDYASRGEPRPGELRVWSTPQGDGVGLYLFAKPPDIPRVASVGELRNSYQPSLDVAIVRVGEGARAVQVLAATAQQPSGLTFTGSLTLPFRDFSYVLKVQCAEDSLTGLREAIIMDRSLGSGTTLDPYAVEFDVEFPDHPLSRARRVLAHLRATVVVNPEIQSRPAFVLPG